jgi:hypothetical protein
MTATKKLTHALTGRHRDYSDLLPSKDSSLQFDEELAFALSSIRYIREHAPTVPEPTAIEKKHLDLVDGIALLLVTEDTTDVAAVSFIQTPKSIDFYFAKNRPCTDAEIEYIESLLKLAEGCNRSTRTKCMWEISRKALSMCIRKVRNRIRKISLELDRVGLTASVLGSGDVGNHQIWQNTGNVEKTIARAIVRGYSKDKGVNISDKEALVRYFCIVKRMNVSVKDLLENFDVVFELVMLSYRVGMTPHFYKKSRHITAAGSALSRDPIINNPILIRRIQKLGDYVSAAQSIADAMMMITPVIDAQPAIAIRFTEVSSGSLSPRHTL